MDLDQETELVTGNIEEQASLRDLFVLVKQDWWLLLLGIISFGLVGVEVSCVYILMSQAIDVSKYIIKPCDIHWNQCRYLPRPTQMCSLMIWSFLYTGMHS